MSGITAIETRGLKFTARCDFCGKSAEHAWLLFESRDGKNHVCNDCVCAMCQAMSDKLDELQAKEGA